MSTRKFKYGDIVTIFGVPEDSELHNRCGAIVGIAQEFAGMAVYIVVIYGDRLSNGFDTICITEHCLKSADVKIEI